MYVVITIILMEFEHLIFPFELKLNSMLFKILGVRIFFVFVVTNLEFYCISVRELSYFYFNSSGLIEVLFGT